ncbi:MAG: CRTAC1 family protein [Chloroflexota bacterium]
MDNDGWLDLFLAASTTKARILEPGAMQDMHHPRPNYLFLNNGDGTFADIRPTAWEDEDAARASMGAAYADYDNDGWVDFVVGDWDEGYKLYRNEGLIGAENHWLTIRLEGAAPINRDAIGARVYVQTDDGRTQMQEVKSGSSLGAGSDTALHFGLGQAKVKQVRVRWPDGF